MGFFIDNMDWIVYNWNMKKYLTLKNLGWLLTAIVTFMLGMSGLTKITSAEQQVTNFTAMNLLPYMALVGVMEVVGVIALCIPRTSIYGAVILSSVMSGAVALHLSLMGGAGFLVPVILGAAAWAGHCLRTYTK
ncbi:DoxX family [uncultured Caudovirales phage]|uniref:DoxX family n=1 Tax=uncultured Caudovirales phage TaxID=2100421 RepID=A0A6J5L6E0_9CAUD|nr:DoxX family [uncultured Caudovirales phage]